MPPFEGQPLAMALLDAKYLGMNKVCMAIHMPKPCTLLQNTQMSWLSPMRLELAQEMTRMLCNECHIGHIKHIWTNYMWWWDEMRRGNNLHWVWTIVFWCHIVTTNKTWLKNKMFRQMGQPLQLLPIIPCVIVGQIKVVWLWLWL